MPHVVLDNIEFHYRESDMRRREAVAVAVLVIRGRYGLAEALAKVRAPRERVLAPDFQTFEAIGSLAQGLRASGLAARFGWGSRVARSVRHRRVASERVA